MSERIERFEVEGTPTLQVRLGSGSIRLVEGPTGSVAVRLDGKQSSIDRFRVEQAGDLIVVEPEAGRRFSGGSVRVTVESGTPPEVRARVGSGDVVASSTLAGLQVDTGSGDVRLGSVTGDLIVRAASGDLTAGSLGGNLKVTIASGDVRVGEVGGRTDAKSASGDIRIETAVGSISTKTASGDVRIGCLQDGDFDGKTLSGSVVVGIPSGRTLEVDLDTVSGRTKTDFPIREGGGDGGGPVSRISVKTVSGNIVLRPA